MFSSKCLLSVLIILIALGAHQSARLGRRRNSKERCPRVRLGLCCSNPKLEGSLLSDHFSHLFQVKALRNFQVNDMMGFWYVVQYYASSEESAEYGCMQSSFTFAEKNLMHITMNFSYIYAEDPLRQPLYGNITWFIPNMNVPAHWMHTEYICM